MAPRLAQEQRGGPYRGNRVAELEAEIEKLEAEVLGLRAKLADQLRVVHEARMQRKQARRYAVATWALSVVMLWILLLTPRA